MHTSTPIPAARRTRLNKMFTHVMCVSKCHETRDFTLGSHARARSRCRRRVLLKTNVPTAYVLVTRAATLGDATSRRRRAKRQTGAAGGCVFDFFFPLTPPPPLLRRRLCTAPPMTTRKIFESCIFSFSLRDCICQNPKQTSTVTILRLRLLYTTSIPC